MNPTLKGRKTAEAVCRPGIWAGSTARLFLALAATIALGGCFPKEAPPQAAPTPAPAVQTPAAATADTSGTPAPSQAPSVTPGAQAASPTPAPTVAPETNVTPKGPHADLSTDSNGLSKATVVVKTSKGILKFKLYSSDAPNTVKRFAELVESKFYNGLKFHRVVPDFVAQVGDPATRGSVKDLGDATQLNGGSGTKLKSEVNGRKHVRGAIGMARPSNDPNGADSQFYFMLKTYPHLDSSYTVIGQVVDFGEKVGDADVLQRLRQWDEIIDMHLE